MFNEYYRKKSYKTIEVITKIMDKEHIPHAFTTEWEALDFHYPHNMHVATFHILSNGRLYYSEFYQGDKIKTGFVNSTLKAIKMLGLNN